MHYYSHNIGDYRRDTGHLTMLEHGAYRQLLDSYYLSEKPLTLNHADLMRTHCARTAEEVSAMENVLKDFFVATADGYIHKRCDIEIEAFHAKSTSASESAKARWARVRAEKEANAMRTHSEGNANHKPITNNQEPQTKDQKPLSPKATTAKKKTKIPDPFMLTAEMRSWAAESAPAVNVKSETESFVDYWRGEAKTKADWPATWRNWIRRAQQSAEKGGGRGGYKPFNKQAAVEENNRRVVEEIAAREAARIAGQPAFDLGEPVTIEGDVIHVG